MELGGGIATGAGYDEKNAWPPVVVMNYVFDRRALMYGWLIEQAGR